MATAGVTLSYLYIRFTAAISAAVSALSAACGYLIALFRDALAPVEALPAPRQRFDFSLSADSHHHALTIDTRKPSHVEVDRLMLHGRLPLHA